ncbi:MAG: amino acid permease [Planctomycetota bacterium]|nr:amino acid permease [Planctomycetota bacterium]
MSEPEIRKAEQGGERPDDSGELERSMGPSMAVSVVVGCVVGVGIFFIPGRIAASGASFPLIISTWVVVGLACFLAALCFAEMALMYPRSGGQYVYLGEAYGRPVAFMLGWAAVLIIAPSAAASLSVAFVETCAGLFKADLSIPGKTAAAAVVLAVVVGINLRGARWGGGFQTATTLVKVVSLCCLAILPFLMGFFSGDGVDRANYSSVIDAGDKSPFALFALVMVSVMFAYEGWQNITTVAGEIREPQRNIPRALFAGLALVTLLYVAANLAFHGVLSMEEVASSKGGVAQDVTTRLLGPAAGGVIVLVILFSTIGSLNGVVLANPRVLFAMGKDYPLIGRMARIHPRYGTPSTALLTLFAVSVIYLVAAGLFVVLKPEKELFGILSKYMVFATSIFYFLSVLASIVLRFRRPDAERPFRMPLFPLAPVLFLALYGWFLSRIGFEQPVEAGIGLLVIIAGLGVYFLFFRRGVRVESK